MFGIADRHDRYLGNVSLSLSRKRHFSQKCDFRGFVRTEISLRGTSGLKAVSKRERTEI